jgi:hypothetical protein
MSINITRGIIILLICFFYNSCMEILKTSQIVSRELKIKPKIYLGMLKEEFYNLYPRTFFYEYQKPFMHVRNAFFNPYKVEIRKIDNVLYEIIYTYTSPSQLDNIINDEELTPYIFKDNKLVGIGWDNFNNLFFKK